MSNELHENCQRCFNPLKKGDMCWLKVKVNGDHARGTLSYGVNMSLQPDAGKYHFVHERCPE